jgi:acyl-CoA dehydrogenase family protein 9
MTDNPAQDQSKPDSELDKDVSPAKALFCGTIVKPMFWPFPQVSADEKETLQMVVESIDRFLEDKADDFHKWDDAGAQPEEFIQSLRDQGLFGLIIPEEYGDWCAQFHRHEGIASLRH